MLKVIEDVRNESKVKITDKLECEVNVVLSTYIIEKYLKQLYN